MLKIKDLYLGTENRIPYTILCIYILYALQTCNAIFVSGGFFANTGLPPAL